MGNKIIPSILGLAFLLVAQPALAEKRGEFDSSEVDSTPAKVKAGIGLGGTAAGVVGASELRLQRDVANRNMDLHRANSSAHSQESWEAEKEIEKLSKEMWKHPITPEAYEKLRTYAEEKKAASERMANELIDIKRDLSGHGPQLGNYAAILEKYTLPEERALVEREQMWNRYAALHTLRTESPEKILDYFGLGTNENERRELREMIRKARASQSSKGMVGKIGSVNLDEYQTALQKSKRAAEDLEKIRPMVGLSQVEFEKKLSELERKRDEAKNAMNASLEGFKDAEAKAKFADRWAKRAAVFSGAAAASTLYEMTEIYNILYPSARQEGTEMNSAVVSRKGVGIKRDAPVTETADTAHEDQKGASEVR